MLVAKPMEVAHWIGIRSMIPERWGLCIDGIPNDITPGGGGGIPFPHQDSGVWGRSDSILEHTEPRQLERLAAHRGPPLRGLPCLFGRKELHVRLPGERHPFLWNDHSRGRGERLLHHRLGGALGPAVGHHRPGPEVIYWLLIPFGIWDQPSCSEKSRPGKWETRQLFNPAKNTHTHTIYRSVTNAWFERRLPNLYREG